MRRIHLPHRPLLALFLLLAVAAPANAETGWSPDFYVPGAQGEVLALVEYQGGWVAGGLFWAVGTVPATRIAFFDGSAWNPLGEGLPAKVTSLAVRGDTLVAACSTPVPDAGRVTRVHLWDGSSWSELPGDLPDRAPVAFFDGTLFCGSHSWDGDGWTDVLQPDGEVLDLIVHEGLLVMAGDFASAGAAPAANVAAWDGAAVIDAYPGRSETWKVENWNGVLVAAGPTPSWYSTLISYWDGAGWVDLGDMPLPSRLQDLCVLDGELHLASFMDYIYIREPVRVEAKYTTSGYGSVRKWTDIGWEPVAGSEEFEINCLLPREGALILGGGLLRSGGDFAYGVARCVAGEPATPLVEGGWGPLPVGSVNQIAVGDEGLAVGGSFISVGGIEAMSVALRSGGAWEPRGLSPQTQFHESCALGWHQDQLYCNVCTGIGTFEIARWVGGWEYASFYLVYPYVPLIPDEILEWNDRLLVLDSFQGVIVWIKNFWSWGPFPDPDDVFDETIAQAGCSQIWTMNVWQDKLVAAGSFTEIDGTPALRVACYDGETWSALGDGLDGWIGTVLDWNGTLVVAGEAALPGETPYGRVFAWDGAEWTQLGGVGDDDVRCLAVHEGQLYAGGRFTEIDGQPANHVARWDGAVWQPLDGGVDGPVFAMASYDGKLWVQGNFGLADGRPAVNLCSWTSPAVPVSLQDLTAVREAGGVRVSWTMSSPLNGSLRVVRIGDGDETLVATVAEVTEGPYSAMDSDAPSCALTYEVRLRYDADHIYSMGSVDVPEVAAPARTRLAAPHPNPFNPQTEVAFDLARRDRVSLTVHDLRGRRVATLLDGDLEPGRHVARWDGRDADGRMAPSGIYFLRLTTPEGAWTRKAVVAR